jgi:F-type H+-transporting ATPase subunit c
MADISISGGDIVRAVAYLGSAISVGVAAVGAALGEGFIACKAIEGMVRRPELQGLLTRTMLLGMAVTETTSIYGLVVALLLIFVAGK